MELSNVGALVTGGASGLGEATVRRLVRAGAKVTIADLDEVRSRAIIDELGSSVDFVRCDVTSSDDVEEVVSVASGHAPLRVAVNCAGIGIAARLVGRDGTPHDFDSFNKVIGVSLGGTFNVLRLAAAQMAKEEPLDDGERGVVIITASIAAYDGQIGQTAYASAKGGTVGLTLPAARDLGVLGVRVMTIAPGAFLTPSMALAGEDGIKAIISTAAFPKRPGHPDEFAALAEHICTNRMLNGSVIRLDAGVRFTPK
jgi:NAD(P)-dependent dehydrogenase (short-subunit alcohol dehydrogenase family)